MGHAPFLPVDLQEMRGLGWDRCDVVIVSGDAYVDHPSFGTALVGRYLESLGLRVGILAQPDWNDPSSFLALGVPRLFAGVTAGAMDSMVNRYTSLGRIRSGDDYSEGGRPGRRPDRAVLVYANRIRQAMPGVPVVLGGIEASLRRISHFDFWSGRVRRSILLDAKADILVYGMAERQLGEIVRRLEEGAPLDGIAGTAVPRGASGAGPEPGWLELPSHEEVESSPRAFMEMTRILEAEAGPWCGRTLYQRADTRAVVVHPPAPPLTTGELDSLYGLPFARRPHPSYREEIPAWTMIRDSITAVRGCAGGCSFCALGLHQGRHVASRSEGSVLEEARLVAGTPWFRGTITDVGGPTANMYGLGCTDPAAEAACRRPSCLHPSICPRFGTDHTRYSALLDGCASVPGVRRVLVSSGIRHDLALLDPGFVAGIARRHVGGHLKIAPESFSDRVLELMRKPGRAAWRRFLELFARVSAEAGREQYVLPYIMAAFPGCGMEDMRETALELARAGLRPEQVQLFLPTPMTTATAMFHTGLAPDGSALEVARGDKARRDQLAVLGRGGNKPTRRG